MTTLVEAAYKARGSFHPPSGVVSGRREAIARWQSRPHLLRSPPENNAFQDAWFGDRPDWSDGTVLTVIALMSVFSAIMWTGIGVILWLMLAA
jgi:hypothetical protein